MEYRRAILHPGEMGASIAAALGSSGAEVCWVSDGRSPETRERASRQGLIDLETIQRIARECNVVVSVCPPAAAEGVAREIAAQGFRGMYLDANAISPQRARRIGTLLGQAGITFVDGSIIGPPAWRVGTTHLHLSGTAAEECAHLFSGSLLEVHVDGEEIGAASALKMCFAAYSKGTTALIAAILAAADRLGVGDLLHEQWSSTGNPLSNEAADRVREVTRKAWRFAGEMEEISATFDGAGLPGNFHAAAAELYRRIAPFKSLEELPPLGEVLDALRSEPRS